MNKFYLFAHTPISNKTTAEIIAKELIKYLTFSKRISANGNAPATHCGVKIMVPAEIIVALGNLQSGLAQATPIIPQPPTGTWGDLGLTDKGIAASLVLIEFDYADIETNPTEEFTTFAAKSGLVPIAS